ncbi:MAG: DUF4625 domain-containing protein [Tannerella sp.]|jgi:hypothetical protein|nr:DUF4625 domain-containing protein [Tannerella sp.]
MKTVNNIITTIIVLTTFTFISCEENGDTTSPLIHLIAPAEGAELMAGKDIHFDMEISDNEMLKSYKVEIHNNMENPHSHEKAIKALSLKPEAATYFSYQHSWDVSDKKNAHIHHHEIEIPEDAISGAYHLIVYCTDAAGNESHVTRNITIIPDDGSDDDHDHDHDHDH